MKFLTIIFLLLIWITNVNADNAYNIWKTNINKEMTELSKSLKNINTKYKTNLDIVFLGIDNKKCYKETNYIKCSIDNYSLMGNYIWMINAWLKIEKNKWDVNSYMSANVQQYRDIINEIDMKNIQDNIIQYLIDWNYYWAWKAFIQQFDRKIKNKCNSIKQRWIKYNIKINNCEVDNLTLINWKLKVLENKNRETERILLEKQAQIESIKRKKKEELVAIERQKQINILKEVAIKTFLIIGFLFLLYKFIYSKYLYFRARKETKDLKELKLYVKENNKLLKNDKETILEEINQFLKEVEIMLSNRVLKMREIEKIEKKIEWINYKIGKMILKNQELDEINEKMNKIKSIDL